MDNNKLENAVANALNDIIEEMKGADDHCLSYEQLMSNSGIAECVIDCAKHLTESRPEFAGLTINSGNGFVEFGQEELKTVRLISPLKVSIYEPEYDDQYDLSARQAVEYADIINGRITEYIMDEERERGLMHWRDECDSINNKVYSAFPSVEVIDGELKGVTTLRVRGELDNNELRELRNYLTGQYSDGWGEGFEQQEIKTGGRDCPEIYVSFWGARGYELTVEDTPQQTQDLSM
ncbi:MAG: hypothetical protein IJ784_03490 [Ruminiclostridium sp.]|nr:hypothetical protein [Ruminiclostridium sp.]